MSGLRIFQNREFGAVRVVEYGGEPWFVARDVCAVLGTETRDLPDILEHDEQRPIVDIIHTLNDSTGLRRDSRIISEPGLYSLVLRSRKPEAKAFKRWIVHEVIPSIRRTGGYGALALPNFRKPAEAARAWADKEEQRLLEEQKRLALEQKMEEVRPKVVFAESIEVAKTSILVGEMAKLIKQATGYDIGQNRFFEWLRNRGYRENPEAENIENHTAGYGYYFLQLPGKHTEWVNVYVMNRYGSSNPGNLVYPEYGDGNLAGVSFDPGRDVIWTHDFNFTPLSSVILQTDKDGNVYAVDEIVLSSAVAKQAAVEFCERYAGFRGIVYLYGDASGHVGEKHGHASDYVTLEQELRRNGFRVQQKVPRTNPAIKDGQASLNAKICDAMNTRSFFVNKGKCPMLHKGLSTLKLKGGSTFQEEDAEYQHITTAVRYYTAVEFPIKKRDVFFGSSHG